MGVYFLLCASLKSVCLGWNSNHFYFPARRVSLPGQAMLIRYHICWQLISCHFHRAIAYICSAWAIRRRLPSVCVEYHFLGRLLCSTLIQMDLGFLFVLGMMHLVRSNTASLLTSIMIIRGLISFWTFEPPERKEMQIKRGTKPCQCSTIQGKRVQV